jgi:hypothetical protein
MTAGEAPKYVSTFEKSMPAASSWGRTSAILAAE